MRWRERHSLSGDRSEKQLNELLNLRQRQTEWLITWRMKRCQRASTMDPACHLIVMCMLRDMVSDFFLHFSGSSGEASLAIEKLQSSVLSRLAQQTTSRLSFRYLYFFALPLYGNQSVRSIVRRLVSLFVLLLRAMIEPRLNE